MGMEHPVGYGSCIKEDFQVSGIKCCHVEKLHGRPCNRGAKLLRKPPNIACRELPIKQRAKVSF